MGGAMNIKDKEKKEKEQWLKAFGAHVRKIRLKKGFTGGELSRELMIDKSNLIRIEKGRVNTSIYLIRQICQVLEISLEEFFEGVK